MKIQAGEYGSTLIVKKDEYLANKCFYCNENLDKKKFFYNEENKIFLCTKCAKGETVFPKFYKKSEVSFLNIINVQIEE